MPSNCGYQMILFADDSTVIIENRNGDYNQYLRERNSTLAHLIAWMNNNNFEVNANKTKVMSVNQTMTLPNLKVTCGDMKVGVIEEVNVTKFLGITVDRNMSFNTHSQQVCAKLYTFTYGFYKLSKTADRQTVAMAYHGFVRYILRYGAIFWGNSPYREIIFRAQKRCIRAVCNLRYIDSCRPFVRGLRLFMSVYPGGIFVCKDTKSSEFP